MASILINTLGELETSLKKLYLWERNRGASFPDWVQRRGLHEFSVNEWNFINEHSGGRGVDYGKEENLDSVVIASCRCVVRAKPLPVRLHVFAEMSSRRRELTLFLNKAKFEDEISVYLNEVEERYERKKKCRKILAEEEQ